MVPPPNKILSVGFDGLGKESLEKNSHVRTRTGTNATPVLGLVWKLNLSHVCGRPVHSPLSLIRMRLSNSRLLGYANT